MDPFEEAAAELERLATTPQRAAAVAAPRVLEAVKAEFAAGRLRGLVPLTTVRAEGATIVLEFDDRIPIEALHADPLPPTWAAPIEEAVRTELA